jgi:GTPase SAR1 family protein
MIPLLRRVWPRKERNKPDFDILCPFCFERFAPDKVVFRATHNVCTDPDYCLREDKFLEIYRAMMGMKPAGLIEPVIEPETVYEESRLIIKGVYKQIKDKYGYVTRRRLCPYCHNELPPTSVKGKSIIISIIGSSKVGKSSFMASLLHEIEFNSSERFASRCIASGDKYQEKLKENVEKLFERGEMLNSDESKTGIEHISLFWRFDDDLKEPFNIIFYDVNSEAMLNENYLELYAQNIKHSDGIIFLIDPTSLEEIRKKLGIRDYINQRDAISNLYNDYIVKSQNMVTDIPTAVVITKSDTLVEDDLPFINADSPMFNSYKHEGRFNTGNFEEINEIVKSFIMETDFPLYNTMDTYFSNMGFFAVSSLGINYSRGRFVKPLRVDEPFLWILYRLGLIEGE